MIRVNIDKAKGIAHDMRRAARAQEFEPLDAAIAKRLPGVQEQSIEAQRQAVRDKYAQVQERIDAATDVEAIKAALVPEG
jgi:hypothetical protein